MSNAGQDDVDRALAAAGVPAMRYFNFRNLRFVRGPAGASVETFGTNAADLDLHDIRPPGLERFEAPVEIAAPVETAASVEIAAPTEAAPPMMPMMPVSSATIVADPRQIVPAIEGPPAHVEPHFGYEPHAPEPQTREPQTLEPKSPAERAVEPVVQVALVAAEPAATKPVPLAAEVAPLASPEPSMPEPSSAESVAEDEAASLPPTSPPPDPPPAVPPPLAPPPPPAVTIAPPEPPRAPEPIAAARGPTVRETLARVVETEAPVFELEPVASVAPPAPPPGMAAVWPQSTAGTERDLLAHMFTTLTDRADVRPPAATWGTPETPAKMIAADPTAADPELADPAPIVPQPSPEFRLSDYRISDRSPAPSSRPAEPAEPIQASPVIFGLAERLASRPQTGAGIGTGTGAGLGPASRLTLGAGLAGSSSPTNIASAPPARAPRASPLRRPEPGVALTAESLFRRL